MLTPGSPQLDLVSPVAARNVASLVLLGRLAVLGPILFTVAWLIGGVVQDGYSPRQEDISALAALDAQHAWLMMAGFLLLGAGTVALAAGLAEVLKGRRAAIGSILVALAGLGIIVAGLARNDCSSELEACASREEAGDASWHSATHDLVSLVIFVALTAAPLVLAGAIRSQQSWHDLRRYCLVTGLLCLVLLVLYGSGVAAPWNGLVQRVFVSVPFLWIAILGGRLVRVARLSVL